MRKTFQTKLGKFARYYGNINDDGSKEMTIVFDESLPIINETAGIFNILQADIAPFVTELIEMARVLGVTGQEKGND